MIEPTEPTEPTEWGAWTREDSPLHLFANQWNGFHVQFTRSYRNVGVGPRTLEISVYRDYPQPGIASHRVWHSVLTIGYMDTTPSGDLVEKAVERWWAGQVAQRLTGGSSTLPTPAGVFDPNVGTWSAFDPEGWSGRI